MVKNVSSSWSGNVGVVVTGIESRGNVGTRQLADNGLGRVAQNATGGK